MRVVQICHRFYPNTGGVERHVYEISRRLAKKFEVEVVSADRDGLPKFEVIEGVKVFRFRSLHPSNAYYFSPHIYMFLKRRRYDIVHIHNYHAFPALFASFVSDGFVFTPHYHGRGSSGLRNFLNRPYKILAKRIFERARAILCVSKYEKDLISQNFNIEEKKVWIIPNGVDLDRIKRAKRLEYGDFVLYVGRLERYKNVDILIKAMNYLPEYRLYIAGDGNYRLKLERLVDRLDLGDRVVFLGRISEDTKFGLMKSCSVFVNLSSIEAFGITVLEALACGRPVVVNVNSGLIEFVERFNCVKPTDLNPRNVAESIKIAMGCDVDVNVDEFSWDNVVKRIEPIYESVMGE